MLELTGFGLVWGASIAMMTLGLGISWRVLRILDFGLAGVYAVASYSVFVAVRLLDLPAWAGIAMALVTGPIVQIVAYQLVYGHFLRRKEGLATVVLLSLAMLYIMQNLLILVFGSAGQVALMSSSPVVEFGAYRVTVVDLASLGAVVLVVAACTWAFTRTLAGLTLKAAADNAELANTYGVSANAVRIGTFALSGFFVSIPAALGSLYEPITPTGGFTPILFAFAAFVIASVKKGMGIVEYAAAGLALGLISSVSLLAIPSKWQLAVPFVAMTVVIAVRRGGMSALRAV